jgi:hypothetical protein
LKRLQIEGGERGIIGGHPQTPGRETPAPLTFHVCCLYIPYVGYYAVMAELAPEGGFHVRGHHFVELAA